MEREGLTGFELMVLVVGVVAAAVIGVVWAGASLALLLAGCDGLKVHLQTADTDGIFLSPILNILKLTLL